MQKISFVDKTIDVPGLFYNLVDNILINGNYYFPKVDVYDVQNLHRNIEIGVTCPKDYKVSLLPKNIGDSVTNETITYSADIPHPDFGSITLNIEETENYELFKNLDIIGSLKNNQTGEKFNFKTKLGE